MNILAIYFNRFIYSQYCFFFIWCMQDCSSEKVVLEHSIKQ